MKYAVISDVHANLEALETCLKKIEKLKPNKIICLGDIVDYGAQPDECAELIRKHCDEVILGNHDEAQFRHELAQGFSENAYISSLLTRQIISPEFVEYFKTLRRTHIENNLFFVHGSPCFPENYNYVLHINSARLNFSCFSEKVCFIGHSHLPLIFEKEEHDIKTRSEFKLELCNDKRYIINVGSVGQPRDHDPRASFGFLNMDSFEYENIRVEYDIKKAADKILRTGLPEFLAYRLYEGI